MSAYKATWSAPVVTTLRNDAKKPYFCKKKVHVTQHCIFCHFGKHEPNICTYRPIGRYRLTVPGPSRVLVDLKIYTDLYSHCLSS